jgi:hypothetical protein
MCQLRKSDWDLSVGIEFKNVSGWIGVARTVRIKAGNDFAEMNNMMDDCDATQNIRLL